MSTLTNYNVKVALDWDNPPSEDKAVIFDLSENKFVLGAAGSSGITVKGNPINDATVNNATILTFTNGRVTAGGTGEAVVDSLWFFGQSYKWGNLTHNATSGFRVDGDDLAYTHVTPQFVDRNTALLTIQLNETQSGDFATLASYPNNYITYGEVFLSPDPDGDGHTSDPPTLCLTGKINNQDAIPPGTLTFQNATVGNDLTAGNENLNNLESFLNVNDVVNLFPAADSDFNPITFESPNFITAIYNGPVTYGLQSLPEFTIQSVTYDPNLAPTGGYQPSWCMFINDQQFLTLEIGGNSLGQLSLRSTGSVDTDPRSGVLITSAPNIYFFQPGAKTTTSGSLQPASASAQIGLDLKDGSLNFKVSGTSSAEEIPQTMFYISKSGEDARVGVGTAKPESLLEIKSTQTSSKGFADFILAVPNASASQGSESSRISFVIEDQTLSGSEFTISGSTGAIFSRTLSDPSTTDYQFGSLVFEVDGPSEATQNVAGLEIGFGLNPFLGANSIASIFTGSIVVGAGADAVAGAVPGIYVENYQSEKIAYLGQDIVAPLDTDAGQLILFYNNSIKTIFQTDPGTDSYINVDADGADISNFGIGTASPNSKLDVNGTVEATGAKITSLSTTTENNFVVVASDGTLSKRTSGVGTVDTTGTPANNQIAIFTDTDTIEGDADFTYDGSTQTLTLDNGSTLSYLGKLKPKVTTLSNPVSGEIHPTAGSGLSTGKIYYLDGTSWSTADNTDVGDVKNLLGIAVSSTEVMIRGFYSDGAFSGLTAGEPLYLTTNGDFSETATTTNTEFVRVIGYSDNVSARAIYFDPSPDYFEIG